MKKLELEFLIELFLHKLSENQSIWGFSVAYEHYEKVLKLFVEWCEYYKLFDSESN